MGLQIPSFPVLLSFFFFIFMVLKTLKNYTEKSNPAPGPWKLPLIGNLLQLIGGEPHHRLTNLAKKYGPIMSIQLGQVSTVIISSAETAKQVLKTQAVIFADRPRMLVAEMVVYNGADVTFGPYGDHWRQLRKICALELLATKRVLSLRSIRETEVSNLTTFLRSKAGSPVNLTGAFLALANTIMAVTSIGKKIKEQEAILSVIDDVLEAMGGFSIADVFPSLNFLQCISGHKYRLQKLHQETDQILENIVKEQRESSGEANNLLSVLLELQQNGNFEIPLTNDTIKAVILDMIGGGTETSGKTTEWAMSELMRSPKAMKKAQEEVRRVFGGKGTVDESRFEELKYLKLVIKETMRLHPAGPLIPRECREKTKVNGYDIYPKTKLLINTYAIHGDPNIWDEPEKFWPERFEDSRIDFKGTNFEFIPFGAGKRICPGITLGATVVELFLANLLYHFDWKLPDGVSTLDMNEAFKGSLHRKYDLQLVPIPTK